MPTKKVSTTKKMSLPQKKNIQKRNYFLKDIEHFMVYLQKKIKFNFNFHN